MRLHRKTAAVAATVLSMAGGGGVAPRITPADCDCAIAAGAHKSAASAAPLNGINLIRLLQK